MFVKQEKVKVKGGLGLVFVPVFNITENRLGGEPENIT